METIPKKTRRTVVVSDRNTVICSNCKAEKDKSEFGKQSLSCKECNSPKEKTCKGDCKKTLPSSEFKNSRSETCIKCENKYTRICTGCHETKTRNQFEDDDYARCKGCVKNDKKVRKTWVDCESSFLCIVPVVRKMHSTRNTKKNVYKS
jgi:hypothetical protein